MIRTIGSLALATILAACSGGGGAANTGELTSSETAGETVSAEATPAPEETISPAFAPFKLTGKGSKVTRFKIPEDAAAIATITEKGTSNFVVESLAADGSTNELMVNEIGRYSGTVLFDMEAGQHSVAFRIESNGTWTIIVKPIAQARAWDPAGPANGKRDDVLLVSPASSGLAVVTLNHSGSSNFAIVSYEDQGSDLLVNEIGRYAGQTTLPDRAFLLAITADGAWTITPS